jgi:hypothetical protein
VVFPAVALGCLAAIPGLVPQLIELFFPLAAAGGELG